MLKNHLVVAIRMLWRFKLNTLMNVIGLSIAIACCLLLFQYLRFEWTWDRFNENSSRICRVNTESHYGDYDPMYSSNTPELFYQTVEGQVPGFEAMVRMDKREQILKLDNDLFNTNVIYADSSLFSIFTVPVLEGDGMHTLATPNHVVVSRDFAEKHFGSNSEAIGKTFQIQYAEEYVPVTIGAVMKPFPANSRLQGDVLLPWHLMQTYYLDKWGWKHWGAQVLQTYVLLEQGVSAEQAEKSLRALLDDLGITEQKGRQLYFFLQPLNAIHMRLPFEESVHFIYHDTDSTASIILACITLAILALACINVTTMSIGVASRRTREIGVRKVMGAFRSQLKHQFWVENGLLVGVSLLCGIVLSELFLPSFSRLADTELAIHYDWITNLALIVLWAILTFAAGGYPAQVMSGFPIISSLIGALKVGGRGRIRKVLVFAQFTIAISLVAITFVMGSQLRYIARKNLGYKGDQVVVFPALSQGAAVYERIMNQLGTDPGIVSITAATAPFNESWNTIFGSYNGEMYAMGATMVAPDFLSTFDMEIVEGRGFTDSIATDKSEGVIINETFAKKLGAEVFGWDSVIGQTIPGYGPNEIIGIVKDFHFAPLHESIAPLAIVQDHSIFTSVTIGLAANYEFGLNFIFIRLAPDRIVETMQRIENLWPEVSPRWPYSFQFLDDSIDTMYREERRWNGILNWASGLAILIALLGVLGVTLLQVEQRTKEIGIRKVLGAETVQLMTLLTRELSLIVILANVIALPVAWIIANRWIENFAYRVSLTPVPFVSAGFVALFVALLVAGGLVWRIAHLNPANLVRDE